MPFDRRKFLRLAAATLPALGGGPAAAQWFALESDDGRPVENLRLPVELRTKIDGLRGVIWLGAKEPQVTLVEFYDYNCPYCRVAALHMDTLLAASPGLRLGLVGNPIISPMSAEAAKAELAVLALKGPPAAHRFHKALFAPRGTKDGAAAIAVAEGLGIGRARLVEVADGEMVRAAMAAQMRLASALGLSATPSFVIGTAGILGWPGPKSLAGMVASVDRCGEVVCAR